MVLLELSVVPMGTGESVSRHVADCVDLIDRSGLPYELHSMGTVIEGELSEVLEVLQHCIELLAADHKRVSCAAKIDYRAGHTGRLRGKVESVRQHLGRDLSASEGLSGDFPGAGGQP